MDDICRWIEGGVTAPRGFRASGVRCGLKTQGPDVALIVSDTPADVAGVFTRNVACAPCVRYSKRVVESGQACVIVANAGNANAFTGDQGFIDTAQTATRAANLLGVHPSMVLVGSTGVTGKPMPMDLLLNGVELAVNALSPSGGPDAARAIMTTDTRPKCEAMELRLPEGTVRIGAIAKGSGMIAPNMATMLCYCTLDAKVPSAGLQRCLTDAVERTFNCLTIDADTSTNDMVVVMANGASGVDLTRRLDEVERALEMLFTRLVRQLAADGEGATKLVTISVQGAQTFESARRMGKAVANSPLVKTALFGNDPNWGRVLVALGYSGVDFDPDGVNISIAGIPVCLRGLPAAFDPAEVSRAMHTDELDIRIDLQQGTESATVWTCDLTYDYVKINAEYHT